MNRVLVDANVLLDVLTDDPQWHGWSAAQLDACAARVELCINPIVYADISVGFERIEQLDQALPPDVFTRLELPSRLPRRQGLSAIPPCQGSAQFAAAGFLHRCARRHRRHGAVAAGREALPHVLSQAGSHLPWSGKSTARKADFVAREYELDVPGGETAVAVKITGMLGEEVPVVCAAK
jgi:hypothetical protein